MLIVAEPRSVLPHEHVSAIQICLSGDFGFGPSPGIKIQNLSSTVNGTILCCKQCVNISHFVSYNATS